MSEYVEYFERNLGISWHPSPVDLVAVNGKSQLASFFGSGFRVEKCGIERLAKAASKCAWSPVIWNRGLRRSSSFIYSELMTLDFDETDYTLEQAINDWSDTVHIIGITKSHQIEKHSGNNIYPPKDRFRIIVPWEKKIESQRQYSYNVSQLIKKWDADDTCSDAARFFWPCKEIVSINKSGYLQPVKSYSEPETILCDQARLAELRMNIFQGSLPIWIADFVHRGKLPPFPKLNGSRKWACFAVSKKLMELGWRQADVSNLLHDGKFSRTDFEPYEIDAAINSAFKAG